MKKLLLPVSLSILLLGCSGNEEQEDESPKTVKGKFHTSQIIYNNDDDITTLSGEAITGSIYGEGVNIELKNGKLHGKYVYFQGDQVVIYNFVNGVFHGKNTTYRNGLLKAEYNYENGRLTGVSKEWNDGVLVSEKNYKNGQLHGTSYQWDSENLVEIRNYKNGNLNGLQMNLSSKGDTLGQADLKDGTGEFRYKTEDYGDYEHVNNYVKGKLNGKSKTLKDGKLLYEMNYKDNKLEGAETWYYEDGKTKHTKVYKDGIPNGAYTEYQESNGRIKLEGSYKDGNKHGKWTLYNADEEIIEVTNYKNGFLHGKYKKWEVDYMNDEPYLAVEKNYDYGLLQGTSKEWSNRPNYHMISQKEYAQGQLDGKTREWDSRDELTLEENYKNGKRHGKSKTWNGRILSSDKDYENGKLVYDNLKNKKVEDDFVEVEDIDF